MSDMDRETLASYLRRFFMSLAPHEEMAEKHRRQFPDYEEFYLAVADRPTHTHSVSINLQGAGVLVVSWVPDSEKGVLADELRKVAACE